MKGTRYLRFPNGSCCGESSSSWLYEVKNGHDANASNAVFPVTPMIWRRVHKATSSVVVFIVRIEEGWCLLHWYLLWNEMANKNLPLWGQSNIGNGNYEQTHRNRDSLRTVSRSAAASLSRLSLSTPHSSPRPLRRLLLLRLLLLLVLLFMAAYTNLLQSTPSVRHSRQSRQEKGACRCCWCEFSQ